AAPRRRAHRQPRLRDRQADHRPAGGGQPPPRPHPGAGHPRPRAGRARGPGGHAPRRPHRERRVRRFVLGLAWREARGAWRHFGYFLACVTLGVSALVSVGSFADSLEHTVARSAKSLMGGDVEIRSTQPLPVPSPDYPAGPARGVAVTRVRELVAMAQAGPAATQLVEVKAVEAG